MAYGNNNYGGGQRQMKEGSGILFPNDRKQQPNSPDFTGKIMVNGQMMSLAGWLKQGQKGEYFSLKMSSWQEGQGGQNGYRQQPAQNGATYRPQGQPPMRPPMPQQGPYPQQGVVQQQMPMNQPQQQQAPQQAPRPPAQQQPPPQQGGYDYPGSPWT